jgi:hypothetical protein
VSPAFVELWERHDVAAGNSRVKRYLHPRAGSIRLVTTGLQLSDRPGVRLIVGTPADDESRLALATVAELGPWPVDWVLPEPAVADTSAVVA